MKSIQEYISESKEEAIKISQYIRSQFDKRNMNPTIGKIYLMKAPNGKPLLYKTEKIHKDGSIDYFGILLFGKIAGNSEFILIGVGSVVH